MIWAIVCDVIGVIISILLVVGAVKGKPAFLVPHIACCIIGIVLLVILCVVFYALTTTTLAQIITRILPIVMLVFPIYYCLVIISFYIQLRAENKRRATEGRQMH
jgi:Domain of unknown function (DUF4728)